MARGSSPAPGGGRTHAPGAPDPRSERFGMPRVLVLAAAIAAMAAPASADQWSKTFSVGSDAALVIRAHDASVHVSSWLTAP